MAKINFDYYQGVDSYSDGEVEELIYDIVKSRQDYRKMRLKDQKYAVSYHLSPIRENILNWYPFEQDCTILEIGSGCGAITGMLCEKCKSVVSVELSKRRSEINYLRNGKYDNLEIIVGNASDIQIDRKFDYVILNGVFEYAVSFIRSPYPYHDFLCLLSKFLNTDGKILLAIENRLGIKYFAGAREDHTDKYFLGLNDYNDEHRVRTFSREELISIIKDCGFEKYKFYYPYPDYKFPTEIFCDENINDREYGRRVIGGPMAKVEVFDEIKMMQTLRNEKVMQCFANSFLVETGGERCDLSSVLYAKINSSRREKYRIATIIKKEHGKNFVEKAALTEQSVDHICQTKENQDTVLPRNFAYLKGELSNNAIKYPYLENKNMDEIIQELLLEKKYWQIKKIIHEIYDLFMEIAEEKKDIYSNAFVEMFGKEKSDTTFMCIKDCNIDLICDNIYIVEQHYLITDPEWIAQCWIPVNFVIWRMLNELFVKHDRLFHDLHTEDYYKELGIDQDMDALFRSWANHFADNYVSDNLFQETVPYIQKLDLNKIILEGISKNIFMSSLYIDQGEGFSENNKVVAQMQLYDGEFQVTFVLRGKANIQRMRWDPLEGACCRCSVSNCILSGREIEIEPGNSAQEDSTLFMNVDPQFNISGLCDNEEELFIKGNLKILSTNEVVCYFTQKESEMERLKKENIILKELTTTLEGEK